MMKTPADENTSSRGRLFRALVSPAISMVFFAVFTVFFILAAIFPQITALSRISHYEATMGRLATIFVSLGFLDLFHSWYFELAVCLFALHLLVCGINKLTGLRKRPSFRQFTRDDLLFRPHSFSVSCPESLAELDIEKKFKILGFRRLKYYSEDAHSKRIVCEKGPPFRLLSWCYHTCILIVVIGLVLFSRFSSEKSITIPVGSKKSVELKVQIPGWLTAWTLPDSLKKASPKRVEVEVTKLALEYVQEPALRLPDTLVERFLTIWRPVGEKVLLQMTKESIYPRNWYSVLRIHEAGKPVLEKRVGVNRPLRYGGFTFYQRGYEHRFDLNVGGDIIKDIRAGQPFSIPQMEGEFLLKSPRVGVLNSYNGKREKLVPSVLLQYRPPEGQRRREWSTVEEMIVDRKMLVMHSEMTLSNLRQMTILGYRYDPGRLLLLWSGILIVTLMALRIYVPWYQILCHADRSADRTIVTTSIRMVGLFAQSEKLDRELHKTFLE